MLIIEPLKKLGKLKLNLATVRRKRRRGKIWEHVELEEGPEIVDSMKSLFSQYFPAALHSPKLPALYSRRAGLPQSSQMEPQ